MEIEGLGTGERRYFYRIRQNVVSKVGNFRIVTVVIEEVQQVTARETNSQAKHIIEYTSWDRVVQTDLP